MNFKFFEPDYYYPCKTFHERVIKDVQFISVSYNYL
jgi:hypothetical protein